MVKRSLSNQYGKDGQAKRSLIGSEQNSEWNKNLGFYVEDWKAQMAGEKRTRRSLWSETPRRWTKKADRAISKVIPTTSRAHLEVMMIMHIEMVTDHMMANL